MFDSCFSFVVWFFLVFLFLLLQLHFNNSGIVVKLVTHCFVPIQVILITMDIYLMSLRKVYIESKQGWIQREKQYMIK